MKRRTKRSGCGTSAAALHAVFDGTSEAAGVVEHVTTCAACRRTLLALEAQRDAVETLLADAGQPDGAAAAERSAPRRPAVRGLLEHTGRAGREKLADLVYELAKACLIVLPDLKRRVWRQVEPREVPVVSVEARRVNSRLKPAEKPAGMSAAPRVRPPERAALDAARSCLKILEHLEGETPRQVLGTAQYLLFEGHGAHAERKLRALSIGSLEPTLRRYLSINLMFVLMWQKKLSEAVRVGEDALRAWPDDWQLLFNMAVASARLKERRRFAQVAAKLARIVSEANSAYLRDLLRFEVPRLAASLERPESAVEAELGISLVARSA